MKENILQELIQENISQITLISKAYEECSYFIHRVLGIIASIKPKWIKRPLTKYEINEMSIFKLLIFVNFFNHLIKTAKNS